MTVCSKHLSYLLLASLPYFVGCAQKSSASQQNVSSPAPVAQKSIDVVVSPQSVPVNDFADEHLVFKKVLSDDSSSLSISGYNSVQQEDVSFYYNLVNNYVSISVKKANGNKVDISASVSRPDILTWVVNLRGCSLETGSGERIVVMKDSILSPARGNLNFTEQDFADASYNSREKMFFYLNFFERDIECAADEAHARYTSAGQQFKQIDDFFK